MYLDYYRQMCAVVLQRHSRPSRPRSPFQAADSPGRPASLSFLQTARRSASYDDDDDEEEDDIDGGDSAAAGLHEMGPGPGEPFIRENSEAVYRGRSVAAYARCCERP